MSTGLEPEVLEMALEAIRDFAHAELPGHKLLEYDANDEVPLDVVRAMCSDKLGIQLLFIPQEYDGMGGGTFDVYRVCEAMAGIDLGIATGVLATFLGSDPIVVGGTADQRSLWLRRIANEGLLFAYGATEPEAGSDLPALKTTARRSDDTDQAEYVINGKKQWISNGGVADVCTVLANAPGGPSWFVVERGTPGFDHGKAEDKHGIRASNTAALMLDEVRVPADHLVGGVEGQGLLQAQKVFGYTRLMVAAFGLGAGWAALDIAIPYSTERVQGGTPLSEKQGYTHKLLVPNAVFLEAGRAYVEETAERIDADEGYLNTEGAIAKYLSTEAGNAAADASVQALGGYGYVKEFMVEKIRRDVRITTIYEGTSEIMEMTIARDRWQEHIKTRGRYYHDRARELERLHLQHPAAGADIAALAAHALAEVLEQARLDRLTRSQHVLLRLGELIAKVEGAGALARRVARAEEGCLDPKADRRFEAEALGAVSRVWARGAALAVVEGGARLLMGSDGSRDVAEMESALGMHGIHAAQAGLIRDMDRVADGLYKRQPQREESRDE
jgi:alkylation response protein AidB-like acyl-CoA dehydrogenase